MKDDPINSCNKRALRQLPGDDIAAGHCGLAARVLKGHSPKGREICSGERWEGRGERGKMI